MPRFALNIPQLSTGASAGTYAARLGLKLANTAGHRARLTKIVLGGGGLGPQDVQLSFRLRRTDNTSDGTATAVSAAEIARLDPDSLASNVSAKKTYTVDPTTLEDGAVAAGSVNARGCLVLEWAAGEGPRWGKNQTLVLEVAPGSATNTSFDVTVEWEEF
jgi:hypothetical protein